MLKCESCRKLFTVDEMRMLPLRTLHNGRWVKLVCGQCRIDTMRPVWLEIEQNVQEIDACVARQTNRVARHETTEEARRLRRLGRL